MTLFSKNFATLLNNFQEYNCMISFLLFNVYKKFIYYIIYECLNRITSLSINVFAIYI